MCRKGAREALKSQSICSQMVRFVTSTRASRSSSGTTSLLSNIADRVRSASHHSTRDYGRSSDVSQSHRRCFSIPSELQKRRPKSAFSGSRRSRGGAKGLLETKREKRAGRDETIAHDGVLECRERPVGPPQVVPLGPQQPLRAVTSLCFLATLDQKIGRWGNQALSSRAQRAAASFAGK
jgi:hypothetical protein